MTTHHHLMLKLRMTELVACSGITLVALYVEIFDEVWVSCSVILSPCCDKHLQGVFKNFSH